MVMDFNGTFLNVYQQIQILNVYQQKQNAQKFILVVSCEYINLVVFCTVKYNDLRTFQNSALPTD